MRKFFLISILALVAASALPGSAEAATLSKPQNNLGLIGYWSFNEGTSTILHDFSGNVGNATISGTVAWASGKRGDALNFDGTTYATGPSASTYRPTQWSISGWIYARTGSYKAILRSAGGDGYSSGYAINVASNSVAIRYGNGTSPAGSLDSSVNILGAWHHFVITSDGTTWSIYIDGVFKNSVNASTFSYGSAGGLIFGSSNGMTKFDGLMDDFRFYSRALSASEIQALYTAGSAQSVAANEKGLVGHWTFDEGSGTIAHDFSGNGNNGTLYNINWNTGKFGSAVTFTDSGASFVNVPSATSLNVSSALTYSIWLRRSASSTSHWPYYLAAGGDSHRYYGIRSFDYGDYVGFEYSNPPYDGTSYSNISCGGAGDLPVNEWRLFTVTYDGSTLTCYRNGVYIGQNTGVTLNPASTYVRMGTSFNGQADDARIYNYALSADEVANLYKSSGVARINDSRNNRLTDGLIGLWSFDGPDITDKFYDRSGNGHDAYLVGLNNSTTTRKTIGKIGQGFSFGGTNTGGIDLGTSTALDPSRFTITAWVYQNTQNCYNYIYSNARDAGGTNNGIDFKVYCGGGLSGTIWNSTAYAISTTGLAAGQWYHVAFSYDGSTKKIYVDGVLKNSSAQTVDPGTPATFTTCVGSMGNGACKVYTLDGSLDDVRLYNRALTDSEIKQLYNMGK